MRNQKMLENSEISEEFKLKDGRIVKIKRLLIEDYEKNNNYEFVHNWLNKVNKYLLGEFEKEDLDRDKEYFYNILSNKKENLMIGAIFNQNIIASSGFSINLKLKKTRHIGNWGISIHPDFQNQGLATKLLKIIEIIAKEKGLKRLEADYFEGNKIAEHLYIKKLGYKIEGRRKYAAYLKNGRYTDKIMIVKIIDNSLKRQK
jgi:RimJ/RimL family protein N-acetyltransferase